MSQDKKNNPYTKSMSTMAPILPTQAMISDLGNLAMSVWKRIKQKKKVGLNTKTDGSEDLSPDYAAGDNLLPDATSDTEDAPLLGNGVQKYGSTD